MSVRVRYAPSPTGLQHIGGIRTALFNYFFARVSGGSFILRVEDTDRGRFDAKALDDLFATLEWLGIECDEGPGRGGEYGPYVQSERVDLYREKAMELMQSGNAYPCFCTADRLETLRAEQRTAGKGMGYDRRCRTLDAAEARQRMASGESHVIRLKVPLEGKTVFNDIVLGRTGRKNADINPDPVMLKSDGYPTYHLANVIDDHLMKISHVMRAQEWIPSGPLHLLIYAAFGWTPPAFCHLPMVMGKDGQKLSKRHGATAVAEFRKAGYLPEALMNHISLLGWSYDDSREFFSRDDLCELFSLEKVNSSPAVFDYRKLDWFNGQYIRMADPQNLGPRLVSILTADGIIGDPPSSTERAVFDGAFPIIRERLKRLNDVSPMLRFLFSDPGVGRAEDAIPKSMDAAQAAESLRTGRQILLDSPPPPNSDDGESCDRWDDAREADFREAAEAKGWKMGALLQPLRLAVTASKVSPPLFPAIRLLGLDAAFERIDRLAAALLSMSDS